MTVVEFGHQDFDPPCSEQAVWAFSGSRADFQSGLHFWIKTLQAQGWEGRESAFTGYAEAGLCESITESEFRHLVAEYSGSLIRPLPTFLVEWNGFRSGLRMYADWNDVAAVAELADSFVAFYWSTTA
jgi:hypothetical protein